MSEWTFIWAAYAITWGVLCVYTVVLTTRLRRAEQRRAEVESRKGGMP